MFKKTSGIVLSSIKYGDSGKIVSLYTAAYGRLSLMVQGSHSHKSKSRSTLFQPLFQLELEIDYKPGRELQRAREVRLLHPYESIPFQIYKSTQTLFLGEFLYKVLREEESNDPLFSFISSSLLLFDLKEGNDPDFHIRFLLGLSSFLGFYPNNNRSEENRWFNPLTGNFQAIPMSGPGSLNAECSYLLSLFLSGEKDLAVINNISSHLRNNLLDQLVLFYEFHLDTRLHIKSLEVLHELFHT